MCKNEGIQRLNISVTYDRGVHLKYSLFFIPHFSFLISHWSYELAKKDFLLICQIMYKVNYYWFNRQEILQKAKEK